MRKKSKYINEKVEINFHNTNGTISKIIGTVIGHYKDVFAYLMWLGNQPSETAYLFRAHIHNLPFDNNLLCVAYGDINVLVHPTEIIKIIKEKRKKE